MSKKPSIISWGNFDVNQLKTEEDKVEEEDADADVEASWLGIP